MIWAHTRLLRLIFSLRLHVCAHPPIAAQVPHYRFDYCDFDVNSPWFFRIFQFQTYLRQQTDQQLIDIVINAHRGFNEFAIISGGHGFALCNCKITIKNIWEIIIANVSMESTRNKYLIEIEFYFCFCFCCALIFR